MKYCLRLCIVLAMLAMTLTASWAGTVFYVKWDAPPGGNGLSWGTAFRTVTEAMAAVTPLYIVGPGYVGDEVRVAGSTTPGTAIYYGQVTMKAGCKLLGGFSGQGTTRDWKTYQTILDGNNENYRSVVTFTDGCYETTVVDGFYIQHGVGQRAKRYYTDTYDSIMGGGIYCVCHGCPTITNNVIRENRLRTLDYHPTLGGGVYIKSDSPTTFENNVVCNNSASNGGGIFVDWYGCANIRNNWIHSNTSSVVGGGISCENDCQPVIVGNQIYNNTTYTAGAGIYVNAVKGTYYPIYAVITNNTIVYNNYYTQSGPTPAGIYLYNSKAKVSNNIVSYNRGGICKSDTASQLTLRNNDVWGNNVYQYSGVSAGVGDISLDPCLTSDRHLAVGSPCINTGWNSAQNISVRDIDLQPRIMFGIVDIGSDEWMEPDDCAVMYVRTDGDDRNNGLSWETAKKTIQAAINDPLEACEVWVKTGTYSESITMRDGLAVYGGFAGTELTREARNWMQYPTTIDGTASTRPTVSIVSCLSESTTIDGFVIRGGSGYYSGECSAQVQGGGIYCVNSRPLISHNIITANSGNELAQGGGIYCLNSQAKIFSNALIANIAPVGCGIYCETQAPSTDAPLILNNTFADNVRPSSSWSDGGAIYCNNAPNTRIINNILANNTHGIIAYGGVPTEHHHNCLYQNGTGPGEIPPGANDLTGVNPILTLDRIHIQPNSPCRNMGSDTLIVAGDCDIDKQARIEGSHVDIGADESHGCTWLDLTTTGPVEIPLNTTAVVTARVYDPVNGTYVDNLRVDFTVSNGQLLSITNGEGQAGTVTSSTAGYGQTDYTGSVQATVRGTAIGYLKVTASISGCFGTLTSRKCIGVYDPNDTASTEWPMFMHDREHTGVSGVYDTIGDNLNGGTPNWSFTLPSYWNSYYWEWNLDSSPVYAGGKVVVGVTDSVTTGDMYAFDPDANGGNQGIVLWRANTSPTPPNPALGPVQSTPCISNGKVYVASLNGYLYCLQLSDGSQIWSAPVFEIDTPQEHRPVYGSPVVHDGVVYVGNSANTMYAFDANTGALLPEWPVELSQNTYSCRTTSPAVTVTTDNRTFLFVGSENGRVYRMDLDATTPIVESASVYYTIDSSPSIKDGYVYIGSSCLSQNVHKLRVNPLELVSSGHVYAEVRTTPVLFDTNLWVGCDTGHTFFRLHTTGLRFLSSFDSDPQRYFVGSGAFVRTDDQAGIVYTGSDNDKFYCRDAMNLSKSLGTYDGGIYNNLFRASPAIGYVTDGSGHRDRWVFIRDTGTGYSGANGRIFGFKTDR